VDEIELTKRILRALAERKPNEKIFIGSRTLTYREFINMIDNYERLSQEEKQFVDKFLGKCVHLFKISKVFERVRIE
jgi:ribosome assembly protein YihI (activator of Der GTPase)